MQVERSDSAESYQGRPFLLLRPGTGLRDTFRHSFWPHEVVMAGSDRTAWSIYDFGVSLGCRVEIDCEAGPGLGVRVPLVLF